jgi:hypothetical protein
MLPPICFHGSHVDELLPSCDEIVHLLDFTGWNGSWHQALELCEPCEHTGINGIGLGELSESFCEVASLPGVDANDIESVGGEVAQEFSFESSGGFEDDLFRHDFLEAFDEFFDSLEGMGNGELLVCREDMTSSSFAMSIPTKVVSLLSLEASLMVEVVVIKKLLPCEYGLFAPATVRVLKRRGLRIMLSHGFCPRSFRSLTPIYFPTSPWGKRENSLHCILTTLHLTDYKLLENPVKITYKVVLSEK